MNTLKKPTTLSMKRNILFFEINEANNINITYYKERWINENGLEQRLIVSYSLKYKFYQEKIRDKQIGRATEFIEKGQKLTKKINANDAKRFIKQDVLPMTAKLPKKKY